MSDEAEKQHHGEALKAYKANRPLPKHYYRLDKAVMIKAFVEGCKLWGTGWYEDSSADANSYDQVMQLAFFGEVIYG